MYLKYKEMSIELQKTSLDIWKQKYQLKDKDGKTVDKSIEDTYKRVARALADVEPSDKDVWYETFLWAMKSGAIPAGRILSNAGAGEHKPATSLINCTVSDTIQDSMESIMEKLKEAALTLKAGCGIGYCFSTIRPKGAYVSGAGATTSGSLSFMDIYDKMCFTISSAGGRRGAQMGTLDIRHPDTLDFIKAKREDGRLRQFNLSLLVPDEFMKAVEDDSDWKFIFPISRKERGYEKEEIIWKKWECINDDYVREMTVIGELGVACRVYGTIKARELWDIIMRSTYDFAEPGILFINRINEMNNNRAFENIRAVNPCGEQILPPYGACLLGSIDLTRFVVNPFKEDCYFDYEKYKEVVRVFTRMLDNVVEIANLPLEQQRNEIKSKRRHGMGYLGLGSCLTMLRMKYGSEESVNFTEEVTKMMAIEGYEVGIELAKEKRVPSIFEENNWENDRSWRGSKYFEKFPQYIKDGFEKHGCRFTHHTSIAPTGTISLSLGNNASNGIEPSFSHFYSRNVIMEGKKSKEKVDVYSREFLAYKELIDPNADPENLPDYFITADQVTPDQHIAIQAAAQKWVDSSISKTINVPANYDYEKFKDIYMNAWKSGLKGCTTFRFNPAAFQGVLVRNKDLEETIYRFKLEDGSTIEAKGNEVISYDGEEHTAANLYDALKEGYYGKF